nr:immunoglobulin heavy chain junction region [Macaca mulatta]MOY19043.1 immunoglobulin heavy chain junction region [Macaca mulatta]MOY19328.1 immunoglobulin heavy chain junction region [Macaca mulatta]MOY19357.1 immunoglobulin heavy chain junction region [Macaca mulatta]MOY19501.1 immunoglobulin heavy chain junction region [Macaca mulatta]
CSRGGDSSAPGESYYGLDSW